MSFTFWPPWVPIIELNKTFFFDRQRKETGLGIKGVHRGRGRNECPLFKFSSRPVSPYLAKLSHFGKIMIFYKLLKVNLVFGQSLTLLWQNWDVVGQTFCDVNGQILKYWSHLNAISQALLIYPKRLILYKAQFVWIVTCFVISSSFHFWASMYG